MIRFIANALLSPIHIIKILLQSIRGAVTPNIGSCGALVITSRKISKTKRNEEK